MNGHFPLGQVNPYKYFFGLAFILGLVFSQIAGADQYPKWLVIIQWQLQAHLAISCFIAAHLLLYRRIKQFSPLIKVFLSALVASIVLTPASLLIDVYILKEDAFNLPNLLEEWENVTPPSITVWLLLNMPWIMGYQIKTNMVKDESQTENNINEGNNPPINQQPAFFNLVGIQNLEQLIALKSELHYLNVMTDKGSQLILYGLKDAINELAELNEEYANWQTHRSYWVNKHHVVDIPKTGREGMLTLTNEYKVLVSRTNMARIKEWASQSA